MALVRFIHPFSKAAGNKNIRIEAGDVGELCRQLVRRFGHDMDMLLDEQGEVSKDIVVLVNRRNVHTLAGIGTPLEEDTEVLIMPYIIGG